MRYISLFATAMLLFSSCTVIRQGEVGVKRRLGKINKTQLDEGPKIFNPFLATILRVPIRTENIEVKLSLPSKEGLTIMSEISILYHIKKSAAADIVRTIGMNYENTMILPVFRSSAADITSKFLAKDMHSGERGTIEKAIKEQMMDILEERGFVIENVLMKAINLPSGLSKAIEEKLQAEQDAQRMEFVKQREKAEAERRAIQADGDKTAQIIAAEARAKTNEIEAQGRANALKIESEAQARANQLIAGSLTALVLQDKQIEAFRALSQSENAKVIITDGKTPLLGLPATGK